MNAPGWSSHGGVADNAALLPSCFIDTSLPWALLLGEPSPPWRARWKPSVPAKGKLAGAILFFFFFKVCFCGGVNFGVMRAERRCCRAVCA